MHRGILLLVPMFMFPVAVFHFISLLKMNFRDERIEVAKKLAFTFTNRRVEPPRHISVSSTLVFPYSRKFVALNAR